MTLAIMAQTALALGRLQRAGLLWGCAEHELARHPTRFTVDRERLAGALLAERDPGFLRAVERGRDLDLWDAVAIALGEDE